MPTSEVPPISGIQPMPASPTHVPSPDVVPSSNFITASQQVANEVSTINVQAHSVTPSANSVAQHSPQVTTSENIAAPNSQAFFIPQTTLNSSLTLNQTQAPSLIQQAIPNLNPGFAEFTDSMPTAFFGTGAPHQSSFMDLMAEPLYSWPNQQGLGLGYHEDLFNFSGLQGIDNLNFNADMSTAVPGMNVSTHGL